MPDAPDDEAPAPPDLPPEVEARLDTMDGPTAERLRQVWRLSRGADVALDPDPKRVQAMRAALDDALPDRTPESDGARRADDRPATAPTSVREARFTGRRRWIGAALAVAVLVAATVGLARPAEWTAPPGETRSVTLAGGTRIELNSETTLRRPGILRRWIGGAGARRVFLDGEAFFDVARSDRSFRVETPNTRVQVLGTRFNVRARAVEGAHRTRVVVAEGRVAVSAGGHTTRLDSAQAATAHGSGPPTTEDAVSVDRALAWRTGGLAFRDAPLPTVAAEVERRFAVPVSVAPDLQGPRLSLRVDTPRGAAALLRDVCRVAGCRVDSTDDGLRLRARTP
jgi:ferric-dicitrate binding protein FerR (iron transport regulator)